MKIDDATPGARILERRKAATPKTVIQREGRWIRVRDDAGREWSVSVKRLPHFDRLD